MSTPGRPVQDLSWLITNFVERVPDVAHAVVVSSDGWAGPGGRNTEREFRGAADH